MEAGAPDGKMTLFGLRYRSARLAHVALPALGPSSANRFRRLECREKGQ